MNSEGTKAKVSRSLRLKLLLASYSTGETSNEDILNSRRVEIDSTLLWDEWHNHIAKGHMGKE